MDYCNKRKTAIDNIMQSRAVTRQAFEAISSILERSKTNNIVEFAETEIVTLMNLNDLLQRETEKPVLLPVGHVYDCRHNGLEAQLNTDTWHNKEELKGGDLLYVLKDYKQGENDMLWGDYDALFSDLNALLHADNDD